MNISLHNNIDQVFRTAFFALALAVLLMGGCKTDMTRRAGDDLSPQIRSLTEGYSLLFDVIDQQKQVDGILFIRSVTPATEKLIKDIAAVTGEASAQFKQFGEGFKRDGIDLKSPGLGVVEAAARADIAEQTTKALLLGKQAERDLILSQAKSMDYVSALAGDLAKRDPDKARSAWLEILASDTRDLSSRAADLLLVKPKP